MLGTSHYLRWLCWDSRCFCRYAGVWRLHNGLQSEFPANYLRTFPPLYRFSWDSCLVEVRSETSTIVSINGIETTNFVLKIACDEGSVKHHPQLNEKSENPLKDFFIETNSIDTYTDLITKDVRDAIIALQNQYGFYSIVLADGILAIRMRSFFSDYVEVTTLIRQVMYLHQQFSCRLKQVLPRL